LAVKNSIKNSGLGQKMGTSLKFFGNFPTFLWNGDVRISPNNLSELNGKEETKHG
jgi:hypothetical protein